jgi:erythromycin esterase-like protein
MSSCSAREVKKSANTLFAEFPPASSLNSSDLDPIRTAVNGKKIVMMGESLHMSSELPKVREKLIRNLHETGDFGLLLFEGSPVEFWIAEEEFSGAKPTVESAANFQRTALFGLWQTDEMRAVVDYALRTQAGAGGSDLYMSSYDVQIGQGRRFNDGKGVFEALLDVLKKRDRKISPEEREAILSLEGLVACSRKKFPGSEEESQKAQQGIDTLSQVVARASRSTEDLHERILALLPRAVGYSLELCREANSETTRNYTEMREEWASKQFVEMFSTLGQKMLIWADSNHVRQSTRTDRATSFGAYIRQSLPEAVFAIQFTGAAGSALALKEKQGKESEPVAKTLLPLEKVTLESKLSALSSKDLFITSQDLPSEFGGQESTRSEPDGSTLIDPRRDFDGYYLVQQINPPRLRF